MSTPRILEEKKLYERPSLNKSSNSSNISIKDDHISHATYDKTPPKPPGILLNNLYYNGIKHIESHAR